MSVRFHPHAMERMNERGASEYDVKNGRKIPGKI